ncbi:MAG: DUF742 domain-containing protein [Pseudonocardia sp.]|nr:DUF742 domain-containing protein [Pseudonocardia sp.]
MSSGPDPRLPAEPTFADVMNGFSFDASRSPRRRRWGRRHNQEQPESQAFTPAPAAAPPEPHGQPHGILPPSGPIDAPLPDPEQADPEAGASAVRPYTWTRGRTKSGFDLAIETLVSTSGRGREQMGMLQVEHRAVAELCEQARSVAEVAALLSLPLGVARVLLGDMAGLGLVTVHQTASSAGNAPDLALMERVLSGLRRL